MQVAANSKNSKNPKDPNGMGATFVTNNNIVQYITYNGEPVPTQQLTNNPSSQYND